MPPTDCPRIDAHTHVFHDRSYLEGLMDDWRLRVVVINITGAQMFAQPMDARWAAMCALKDRYPERVALCTTFDPAGVAEHGFAERTVRKLAADLDRGATMVKVWKDVGLEVQDGSRYVQVDDERFQPVWDFLTERGVPVLAHIAEPRAAWLPLDPASPHYRYYRDHPAYHLHRQDDVPAWEEVVAARDRWVEKNPSLTVVGAHLGSMAHDVRLVAERLDRYPNLYVDTAERFGDLVTQPSDRVRAFFTDYADRILYGTDVIVDRPSVSEAEACDERDAYDALLRTHEDYLAGHGMIEVQDKLVEPVRVEALNLDAAVLRQVVHDNADGLVAF